MGRRKRNLEQPCCYQVTHRCEERRFLLRYEIDRRNYVERLRQMQAREYHVREAFWSEASVVGGEHFAGRFADSLSDGSVNVVPLTSVGEEEALYTLTLTRRAQTSFWVRQQGGRGPKPGTGPEYD